MSLQVDNKISPETMQKVKDLGIFETARFVDFGLRVSGPK
jgi:hypothetical protein